MEAERADKEGTAIVEVCPREEWLTVLDNSAVRGLGVRSRGRSEQD